MYTKQHLLAELKKRGLPHSYLTLMRWEKQGIIPKPDRVVLNNRAWRVYTDSQVAAIIKAVQQ